jgi:hypothetical protein
MQGEGRENVKAGIGCAKNLYSFNAFVFSFSVPSLSLLSILVFFSMVVKMLPGERWFFPGWW